VTAAGPSVAVFGGSEHGPGTGWYEEAREAGAILAGSGAAVVTGGYGGIMEAASRGAAEAGGRVVAVTTRAFPEERPNRWIGEEHREDDLYGRTRRLIELADAFLLFPGRSGTLAEAAFLWALVRAGSAESRPVAAVGEAWAALLGCLGETGLLETPALETTRRHGSGPDAARWLAGRLGIAAEAGSG
jgi:uncharacterized protein (TIGR00730 family)